MGTDITHTGTLVRPVLLIFRTDFQWCYFETQGVSRGNSGYFQRTIVRYTGSAMWWKGDFILCCGLVPAFPRLKSTCPLHLRVRGIPVRRPTLLLPASSSRYITATTLPSATLRLHLAGYGLYMQIVSYLQISPISSRALPGTQQDAKGDCEKLTFFCKSYSNVSFFFASKAFLLFFSQHLSSS